MGKCTQLPWTEDGDNCQKRSIAEGWRCGLEWESFTEEAGSMHGQSARYADFFCVLQPTGRVDYKRSGVADSGIPHRRRKGGEW